MHTQDRGGRIPQLQTGLGRAVSPQWLENFETLFYQEAQSDAHIDIRKAPGIPYVQSEEFSHLIGDTYNGEASEQAAAELIVQLVGKLCNAGRLESRTALSGLSLNVASVPLTARKKSEQSSRVSLRLNDANSKRYDTGFLVEGEEQVVRRSLKLDSRREARVRRTPVHNIGLGLAVGPPGTVTEQLMERIAARLSLEVALLPVGVIRL